MTNNAITSKEFRQRLLANDATEEVLVAKDGYQFRLTDTSNMLKFVFSTKTVDLNGDRVFPRGIDIKNYLERNPLILLHHDSHSFPVGKTLSLQVEGDELIGTVEFFTDLDEANIGTNARAAVELIKRGTMGLSISFIPKEFELNTTNGVDFHRSLLIETSVVSVPCNPESFRVVEPDNVPAVVSASAPDPSQVIRARKAAARSRAIAMAE